MDVACPGKPCCPLYTEGIFVLYQAFIPSAINPDKIPGIAIIENRPPERPLSSL